MKLYLGGKMVGIPGYGFKDFDDAAAKIRALGYEVFNPAERDRSVGFKGEEADGSFEHMERVGFSRRDALATDLDWIAHNSDGMVCLANWRKSPGAKAEIALHQGLFLPVWELADFLADETAAPTLPPLMPGRRSRQKVSA